MKNLLLRQKQILLFVLAGGLSAVVEVGLFKLFSMRIPAYFPAEQNFYGVHYPLSNVLSTAFAIIFNYFLSIWFVFEQGRHSRKREFAYFVGLSVFTTILSLIFFQIFFSFIFKDNIDLGFFVFSPEMLSKISAILVTSVLNYSLKKRVVFNG